MPTVVQNKSVIISAATATLAFAATGSGNKIVITLATEGGSTAYTGATFSSVGGTWTLDGSKVANGRSVLIYSNPGVTAGTTNIVITPTGGTGNAAGAIGGQEVSGIGAVDHATQGAAGAANSCTITAGSADTTATDFVVVGICCGIGNTSTGITSPPTGYTLSAVEQNDNTSAAGQISYKVNTSAVTDTVTWSAAGGMTTGDPAMMISYVAGGGAAAVIAWVT
jgi:hypothetical protein